MENEDGGGGSVARKLLAGESDSNCGSIYSRVKCPKLNIDHTHDEDRLSELPDLVLAHIFSHLFFREAARTCVLSKRFLSLWNSVHTLSFSDEVSGDDNGEEFVSFLSNALGFHRRCDLEKFDVNFWYDSKFSEAVDCWIEFALRKRVKLLHLNLNVNDVKHELPKFLYKNANLVELVVHGCEFSEKVEINWSSMRLLSLTGVRLNEELISRVLFGCPALETLELRNWSANSNIQFKIDSPSLRVLRIVGEETTNLLINPEDERILEISGPNLVSLEVSGWLYRTRIHLSDLGNLENAVMDFEIRDGNQFNSLIRDHHIATVVFTSLCDVKSLVLGGWCMKVLSICEKYNISSPWSERKKLTLSIPITKWDHLGMTNLLNSSPRLETLIISLSYDMVTHILSYDMSGSTVAFRTKVIEEFYWESWKTRSRCPLLHLKRVKIKGLEVIKGSMKPLFEFVEFVLRNSELLEEIVIQSSQYVTPEAFEEALKLLSVSAASPSAIVRFEPPNLWVDLSA